jgi:four helix bundle protein
MTYERFDELPVWSAALDLAQRIYHLTDHPAFASPGDLVSQLRRAALSISNNIAEGFERGSTPELLLFLYIAPPGVGSAGETRSMLHFCSRSQRFANLKSEISNLISLAESCSRQLRGWAHQLQNSDIPGPRRLTDASKARYNRKQRAQQFLATLDQITNKSRPPSPSSQPTESND